MKYSLRQVEVFLATAHFENISRAADSLAMSQSAASSALKEFERQFDIQLFDRAGKKLLLNEFGRLIQPRAEELLERARELQTLLAAQVNPDQAPGGSLKVGATLSIGNYLVSGFIARYMAENPGTHISLEVANTAKIAEMVSHFDLDVGLIEGEIHHSDLDISRWREDDLVVFCAPDHPYGKLASLSEEHLLAAAWILREQGSGTRQAFDRAMHGLLPKMNILMELQHTEAIKRTVEAGLGIGCLSEITLTDAFRRGSLVPLATPGKNFHRYLYTVVHKQKYRSTGLRRWLAICNQTA
ncbi:MAG: LysR family transcriptional regulator [Porticoccaceae bacterium]|nr:LysR family transcriptional regulator [Porticoccaceae bacterium]